MRFKKSISFLAFLVPLVLTGRVFAADIDIVCDESNGSNECEITTASDTLFNVSNWAPGQTVSGSIQVINSDRNDNCNLKMSTDHATANPAGFPKIMFTAIKRNGHLMYGSEDVDGNALSTNNLQDIFDTSHIDFGEVTKDGGVVIYDWVVTFDKNAGNEYQGSNVSFDFGINFVCDHPSSGGGGTTTGTTGGGTVAGTAASVLAFFGGPFGGATAPGTTGGTVAGTTTETGGTQEGAVEGIQQCRDPWLIWLLFVLQFIVLFITTRKFLGIKRKLLYIVLSMVVIPLVFYLFLCDKRLALVSLLISLFWLIF